jgi:pathogenesis-related protein 1
MRGVLPVILLAASVAGCAGGERISTSSPTAGPTTKASRAPNGTAQAFVDAHNRARSQRGLPPLSWSSELAQKAQRAAKTCTGDHSRTSFGENIYGKTAPPEPEEAVATWVRESADYDYARNSCRAGRMCGHYTQVVWRSTKLVGCAIEPCGRWTYVYCAYDPPGNWRGEKPY